MRPRQPDKENLLNQAIARKRCASCEHWRGERQPGATPDCVYIEAETITGLCADGGWAGSERRARSACGHWKLWPVLNPPGEEPLR